MKNKKGTKADPTKCRAKITMKESIADTVPEPRGIRGGGRGGDHVCRVFYRYIYCLEKKENTNNNQKVAQQKSNPCPQTKKGNN